MSKKKYKDYVEVYDEEEFDNLNLSIFISNTPCLDNMRLRVVEKQINNVILEDEVEQLIEILSRYKKNNALIVGKTGIGKTALVESLCQKINRHDVPTLLRNKIIVELSLGSLIAGTRYRGEFEEKLTDIIDYFKDRDDVILFIDEIHNMVKCGGADGAIPMGDILKPYIARGDITIIGATTYEEYMRSIYRDKALSRRFTIINMQEPSMKITKEILENARKKYEEHYNIRLSDSDISKVVMRSFFKEGNYPDKAFDELENYSYEKARKENERN